MPRLLRIAYGALTTLLVVAPAGAQTRLYEARLDSLAAESRRTRAALDAYDEKVRRTAIALDTAHVSPLVVAETSILPMVRRIAPRVADSVAVRLGSGHDALTGYRFVARVHLQQVWARGRRRDSVPELHLSVTRPNGAPLRGWRARPDTAQFASTLRQALVFTAYFARASSLLEWAANAIPSDSLLPADWARHRLLLVSSPSAVARRCYDGDLRACKHALLLTRSNDPAADWHDGYTARQLVGRHRALARRIDGRLENDCTSGTTRACIDLLRQMPPGTLEPAPVGLRAGVLQYAVSLGGPAAVERLLGTPSADPGERIAAAAGMPLDSVVRRWQARIRHTRVPSQDLSTDVVLIAILWATGVGVLSLRSSRWR